MVFNIPTLIEYITKYITLNEGDIIMTGTPAGVGPVKPGDLVQAILIQGETDIAHLDLKVDTCNWWDRVNNKVN